MGSQTGADRSVHLLEEEFGRELRRLRKAVDLTQDALARRMSYHRVSITQVEKGRQVFSRQFVTQAETALDAQGQLLAIYQRIEAARCGRQLPTGEHPRGDSGPAVAVCARESAAFLRQSAPALVEPMVLEQLDADVSRLAVASRTSTPTEIFGGARQLRDEVFSLIVGRHRPHTVRDLYLVAGQLCGILAYASLDLGFGDEAMTQARTAWFCADVAGHHGLRAWVRGTQSLIARFMSNFSDAYQLAQAGLPYATEGTSLIRLRCGEAQCLAHFEDSSGAHRALGLAKDARDRVNSPDALGGLFTFSSAKQSYYSGSSLIWLTGHDDARVAQVESLNAIQLWQAGPANDRSHTDELLAHIYLGTARLHLGDLDGVLEAIRPVLDTSSEHRVSWHFKRLGRISEMLDAQRYQGSALAQQLKDEIDVFARQ